MRFEKPMMLAVGVVLAWCGVASAAPITPGNLVIARVGDGTAALSTAATAVFLDEYTTGGTLVQTIAVSNSGANALTMVGNSTTEGIISPSQDGMSLVFGGYRKNAGGTQPSSDTGAVTNRVIGRVDLTGLVDTSVAITDPTSNLRSVATVNGSTYYLATAGSVRYVGTPGPAATSVAVDLRNSRQVYMTDNILRASNGSTAITGKVQNYGTLPTGTVAAVPDVSLALADAVNGIWYADLSTTVAGSDTVYLLSTVENLLRKYSFDGTNWVSNGSIPASGASDITGSVSSSGVSLFTTSTSALRTFVDTSGYNGTLSASGALTSIATAGTNTGFRGLGILNVVPEPTSLAALGLGMTVLSRRRKN